MRPPGRREVPPGPQATSGPSTHRPAASEGRDEDETKRLRVDALVFSAKHPLAPKGDNFAGTSARATGVRGGSTFCPTVCEWRSGTDAAGGAGRAPGPAGTRRRAGAPAGPRRQSVRGGPPPSSPPGDAPWDRAPQEHRPGEAASARTVCALFSSAVPAAASLRTPFWGVSENTGRGLVSVLPCPSAQPNLR